MKHPEILKYTREHQWVRIEGDFAYVGLTDFAQQRIGEVIQVDIPSVGKELKMGEQVGSLETASSMQELYMPVTGYIVEMNHALIAHPRIINEEPYSGGWIFKFRPNPAITLHSLLDSDSYKRWAGMD